LRVVRHRLYCPVVWMTRNRERLIDAGLATFLCGFLRDVAPQERAHILEIGMVATHVHLLVRVDPTTNISRLLQRLKGGSSAVAGKERHSTTGQWLRWSKGYSMQSVSPRALEAVRQYLRQQPDHHAHEAITDWYGDSPEYELAGQEQWRSPDGKVIGD
ncbi:MAG: IS200/IS605 family transposase, partial [Gemmatimonadales bacterium]